MANEPSKVSTLYWVFSQDTMQGVVKYVVLSSTTGKPPTSGVGSFISGPYVTKAKAQAAADKDNATPGAQLGPLELPPSQDPANRPVRGSVAGFWPNVLNADKFPNYNTANLIAQSKDAAWLALNPIGRCYLLTQTGQAQASSVGLHYYSRLDQAVAEGNDSGPAQQALISQWDALTSASVDSVNNNGVVIATVNADKTVGAMHVTEGVSQGDFNSPTGDCSTLQNPFTASNPFTPAINSLTGFLSALGDPRLWLRITKVLAGGAILIVGLVKLTGLDSKAGGIAAKAVKVAPLL